MALHAVVKSTSGLPTEKILIVVVNLAPFSQKNNRTSPRRGRGRLGWVVLVDCRMQGATRDHERSEDVTKDPTRAISFATSELQVEHCWGPLWLVPIHLAAHWYMSQGG
mmetsp:Transcript_7588/g.20573  ORF Transcript_7588/g.20573 Transcript_7588/m.20573 type:complete len:109 (-) Transcript_7588:132-458(-)